MTLLWQEEEDLDERLDADLDESAEPSPGSFTLAEGVRLAEHGYALTPVTITRSENGKKKAKFHRGWRHESAWSTDPDQIRAWAVDYPDASFALGCGPSGVEGVDLDVKPAEGIDAVAWWGERGLPMGSLLVETPSGGLHCIWAVRDDGRTLPQEAGKTLGRGVDTRNRAGLFYAAGGYVVGEAGHYRVVGELLHRDRLAPTPDEVIALFADAAKSERADRPTDGRIVYHDLAWQYTKVSEALQAIRDHDRDAGGYRRKLQHAGLFYGRVVEQGILPRDDAEGRIREAHMSVWGPDVWPENVKDIRDALSDGPRLERWRVPKDSDAAGLEDVEAEPDAIDKAVALRVRELRIADKARRQFAREQRAHRRRIADGIITDFTTIPEPQMLMCSLIPEDAIGFLAGRSGAYKSFLAASWACCIALGRPWLGSDRFAVRRPLRVLYVAAEGASGVAARLRAWEAREEVRVNDGPVRLHLYPHPIHLTDDGQAEELAEYVAAHDIGFLIVDTYHRSAPGAEENSSTEFGVVFEAVARLRDDHGCGVLFLDHTGASKNGNPRGTSAKRDDADYVLSATYAGEEATAEAQRELYVTKLKDEDTTGRWAIKLETVPDQSIPVVTLGSVGDLAVPPGLAEEWWVAANLPDIPQAVTDAIEAASNKEGQDGRGVRQARWVWRLLAAVNDPEGLSNSDVKTLLAAAKPTAGFSGELVKRGIALLAKTGVAWRPNSTRIALVQSGGDHT